jgi:hypothetical protein
METIKEYPIQIRADVYEGKTMDYYFVVGNIVVENTPEPAKYYEPILTEPTISCLNIIISPNDVSSLRNALAFKTTPTPSQHKKKLKLWWEGNNFGRSGDTTNNTGDIVPPSSVIKMNMYMAPKHKENETTIMFMSDLPNSISLDDSLEMQKKIFQDEFSQWCSVNIPDTKVHLYVTDTLYQRIVKYEPDIAGHFTSIRVSKNIYTDFINMYLGKNLIDMIHPITRTLHFNDKIVSPNIYVGPIMESIKMLSSVTYRSTSSHNNMPCIEFTSNKQTSGSQFVVMCRKGADDPVHCIMTDDDNINVVSSKTTGGIGFLDIQSKTDSLIKGVLYHNKLVAVQDNREKLMAFLKETKEETFTYMVDNPLQCFKNHNNNGFNNYGNTIYQAINSILIAYMTNIDNPSSILFEPQFRSKKHLGGLNPTYSCPAPPNLSGLNFEYSHS